MKLNIPYSKQTILKIVCIMFIILMLILIIIKISNDTSDESIQTNQMTTIFNKVDKNNKVNLSTYSIYGTHLNLSGTIDIIKISGISINYVDLILRDTNGNESEIKSEHSYIDNILSFATSSEINNGVNLEKLNTGEYYIFLKITYSNSDIKYYSFNNSTQYQNSVYYTITKNNSNNKIDINFDNYNDISYMKLSVTPCSSLPDNIYDIAIDPGHGGIDNGAKSGDKLEAELVLKLGLDLKTKLEENGFKVFISRNGSESLKEDTANNMYDENGRVNILNESHAKLLLSLHIDKDGYGQKKAGGVEVYAPSNCNLEFATRLAKNIVETAGATYSSLNNYKKAEGVYVRNYTKNDISVFEARAKKGNYEPYKITTSTPYLYIIRETGGISTNAFVDGRNTSYGKNKYWNSNIGIEAYSIQLGYMNNQNDLNNILENSDKYVDAICNSVLEY